MSSAGRRRKTVVRELPEEVKERILEGMPTRDAARCALLSTKWRDAWSRHGRLVFDWDFFYSLKSSMSKVVDKRGFVVNLINTILMLRAGPVKKFTFDATYLFPKPPLQSDLERWCLFLSRHGVEELELSMGYSKPKYELPLCLVSCQTITQLTLEGFVISFPENASCVFPGLTSSRFSGVEFRGNVNGPVNTNLLKLRNLAFCNCSSVSNFVVSAPQLQSLTAFGRLGGVTTRLLTLHLVSIHTLCLTANTFSDNAVAVASAALPIATNLREITLHQFTFGCGNQLTFLINLLKKSPKLCLLGIDIADKSFFPSGGGRTKVDSTLLEGRLTEGGRCIIEKVKINGFSGSKMELDFLKLILSISTALHEVVICEAEDINETLASEGPKKLLSFPRASPRAKLVYEEYDPGWFVRKLF